MEFTTHAPYDGCFWERNYVLIDVKEVSGIIPILQSSKEPIKTIADIEACVNFPDNHWHNDEFTFYDTANGINLDVFPETIVGELNAALNYNGIETGFTCSECGRFVYNPELIEFTGYTGNGGVGVFLTGAVCSDCWYTGTCQRCGEYQGEDELISLPEDIDNSLFHGDSYVCEYCLQHVLEDNGFITLDNKGRKDIEDIIDSEDILLMIESDRDLQSILAEHVVFIDENHNTALYINGNSLEYLPEQFSYIFDTSVGAYNARLFYAQLNRDNLKLFELVG